MEHSLSEIMDLYNKKYISASDYKKLLLLKPDAKLSADEALEKEQTYFRRFRCYKRKDQIKFEIFILERQIKNMMSEKNIVFDEKNDPLSLLDSLQVKSFLFDFDKTVDDNSESLIRDIIDIAAQFELRTGFSSMNKKIYDEIINNALIKKSLNEEYHMLSNDNTNSSSGNLARY